MVVVVVVAGLCLRWRWCLLSLLWAFQAPVHIPMLTSPSSLFAPHSLLQAKHGWIQALDLIDNNLTKDGMGAVSESRMHDDRVKELEQVRVGGRISTRSVWDMSARA